MDVSNEKLYKKRYKRVFGNVNNLKAKSYFLVNSFKAKEIGVRDITSLF